MAHYTILHKIEMLQTRLTPFKQKLKSVLDVESKILTSFLELIFTYVPNYFSWMPFPPSGKVPTIVPVNGIHQKHQKNPDAQVGSTV